jgi:hypothetical protein
MTTSKLPRRKRIRPPLSFRYRKWLLTGRPGALVFLEAAAVERLWREYSDVIISRHIARFPCSRPVNWWRYNAPELRRPGESQYEFLKRHGLLLPEERVSVDAATKNPPTRSRAIVANGS